MPITVSVLASLVTYAPQEEFLELKAVKDGDRTVLSRYGSQVASSSTWMSLGELIHWRSPRGLNYRTGESAITISAYDRSGSATFRRSDGRVSAASGTLSGLRSKRLVRRVRGQEPAFFLSATKEDYLVDTRDLEAYFGDRLRRNKGRVRLSATHWPSEIVPPGWRLPEHPVASIDRWDFFYYANRISATVDGLHLEVPEWTLQERYAKNSLVQRFTEMSGTFTNNSASPKAIQPQRIGFYDGVSLPCAFTESDLRDEEVWGESFRLGSTKPFGAVKYLRCQSLILAPNAAVRFVYRTSRTPWTQMGIGRRQRLRYADGNVDVTFRADPTPGENNAQ